MRLAWLTDPHFDLLAPGQTHEFGKEQRAVAFDALLVTGDVARADSFRQRLSELASGVDRPIYFVLGNHDFYGASIAETRRRARSCEAANWLGCKPVELTRNTLLAGCDGFYDARVGKPETTPVQISDFGEILDLVTPAQEGRRELLAAVRAIADADAEAAARSLDAGRSYSHVVFATHVPPFEGACSHDENPGDPDWTPWFVNTALGQVLDSFARANPKTRLTVLCGHTHSGGEYRRSGNLYVRTGSARYGHPQLCDVLAVR